MSARQRIPAFVLAGIAAASGCKREVPRIEPSPPPLVTVAADPTPSAPAAADSTPPAPRPLTPGSTGRRAGQRVQVRWKGNCYPAHIVSVPRPGAYFITYDGYDHSWDETVGESRICK
jgi:hypothetical protein